MTGQPQLIGNRYVATVRWPLTRFINIIVTRKMDTFAGPWHSIPFSSIYHSSDLDTTVLVCIPYFRVLIITIFTKGIFTTTGPPDLADALLNLEPELTPWVGVWGDSEGLRSHVR